MFSRLLRTLLAPQTEKTAPDPLASLREKIRQQQNVPTPKLPEETDSQTPDKPATALKLHRFKGMSCYVDAEDNPGMNFAGGFACHRNVLGGRQILALSPCMDMEDDCQTLRDQKLRSNILGVQAFRKGNFPHRDHGTVYWILSGSPDTVDYDFFWEERPDLILHLTGTAPRYSPWEPAVRYAAATMRAEVYLAPILQRGLALERQDDGGVAFHFSDPDPQEPLRPQSFQMDPEHFAHWLQVCTVESFRLERGSDVMESLPSGSGVQLETSDRYGPHLGGHLTAEDLERARSFLTS